MNCRIVWIIAAFVSFFLAGGAYFLQQSGAGRAKQTVSFEKVLEDFSPDRIIRIRCYRGTAPEKAVVLARTGRQQAWTVKNAWGASANMPRVEVLLARLEQLLGEARYRDDKEVSRLLGLSPEDALHLEVFTGKDRGPSWHLLLGRPGGVKYTVFLKKQGDPRILLANMLLYPGLGLGDDGTEGLPRLTFWLDLEACDIPAEEIIEARASWADGRVLHLTRLGERETPDAPEHSGKRHTWRTETTGPWESTQWSKDQEVLGTYVDTLRITLFDGVAGPMAKKDYGLEKPDFQVTFRLNDGTAKSFTVGDIYHPQGDGRQKHYACVNKEDFVYLLSDYQYRKMNQGPGGTNTAAGR